MCVCVCANCLAAGGVVSFSQCMPWAVVIVCGGGSTYLSVCLSVCLPACLYVCPPCILQMDTTHKENLFEQF